MKDRMDDYKRYAVFAATVVAGSMSAAARRLGMTPSAVSQAIRALEQHAGVSLLHRSTRKLTLTEAGARCYPHCRALLDAADAALASLETARDAPSGQLRIAAPVGFAAHIAPALAPLLAESPNLSLHLQVDDAMIDLIEQRIDIAIRVGKLADSNAVARPLCDFEMIVCAAPVYLERHGMPQSPAELAAHHWLAAAREAGAVQADGSGLPALELQMCRAGDSADGVRVPAAVRVGIRIVSNNQLALQQMCEQGLGLARLGLADVLPALQRGALVRVLPHWRFEPWPVSAVTQRRQGEPVKVRAALQALQRYFAAVEAPMPLVPGIAVENP
ncbi:MAG: LysR family transcriptional regulator [Massilia sp.]|nr:LysR family transcriptional regulator [Massilia sp.]